MNADQTNTILNPALAGRKPTVYPPPTLRSAFIRVNPRPKSPFVFLNLAHTIISRPTAVGEPILADVDASLNSIGLKAADERGFTRIRQEKT